MTYHTVKEIKSLVEYNEKELKPQILAKNGDNTALLFALKKEQIFHEHTSPVDAFIYIIEGKVKFSILVEFDEQGNPTSPSQQDFEIKEGEVFFFKANEKHSLVGMKDSKFLVVRI